MARARANDQINLPPMPVQPLDRRGETVRPESGPSTVLPDVSLESAKKQFGRALRRSITDIDAPLKEFGDPSHVTRVLEGEIPNVIARVWMRASSEMVEALARESGKFDVHRTISERKVG